MPVGLILMEWSSRMGTQILTKYPKEINISNETLMQIYASHEYSGDAGLVSLMAGSLNVTSYYTGSEQSLYLILILNLDEDPDEYEDALINVSRIILKNFEEGEYLDMIPSLFQRISAFPRFNDEQKLASVYQEEASRLIIERLRDEGVFTKSELKIWLKDIYKGLLVEVDGILMELIKREIIKETSVKGISSELIFMINDLIISRKPPIYLFRDPMDRGLPERYLESYKKEVKDFFVSYRPNKEDNLKLLDLILDPEIYQVLKLLRRSIVTKNILEKLRKKGVDDLDGILKKLWNNKLVHVFQDKRGIEYYGLISDIFIGRIYPKYILNKIIKQFNLKSKSKAILLEYLNVLENSYYEQKES